MDIENIAKQIVDAALKVHTALGPGLLESAYQACLAHELRQRNLKVECELPQFILYDGIKVDAAYRLDMLVEDSVIIENKTVDAILPIHRAQLFTYLKLHGCKLGFILNWKVVHMREGIKRMVNHL
jgi:GxxExxY protein